MGEPEVVDCWSRVADFFSNFVLEDIPYALLAEIHEVKGVPLIQIADHIDN